MPAQPSYSKSALPSEIYFRHAPAGYSTNGFNKVETAVVAPSGTMRGVGIGTLVVSPFRYNPVTEQLRVYRKIRVRIDFNLPGPVALSDSDQAYSPFFESAFRLLINSPHTFAGENERSTQADLTRNPVTYLIVANENLQGNAKLAELEAWKRQKGFNVVSHYVASSNSVASIDAWVEEQYNTLSPKPSFLLIVGDESGPYTVQTEVTPVERVSRSDLAYGVIGPITYPNHIPSIYVGRFSVRTLGDLTAQVDKTIWYEKGQFEGATPDLAYLATPLGVAGYDGKGYSQSHGNPQISYGWTHCFNESNGMSNAVHYLEPGASSQDEAIVDAVSAGVSFYNYTAHGYKTFFDNPRFEIGHVDALGNQGKYPLVVGSCCLTGSFGDDECFGEAWLNAPNRGAIGFIGASMNTRWNEDLAMAVGTVSAVSNAPPPWSPQSPGMYDAAMSGDYPTQAGLKHCGLLAVENYGGLRIEYWGGYHLFGDPSLMVYFGVPSTQTVAHVPSIALGDTSFHMTTTPGAYVALSSDDGTLYGVGVADAGGAANISIMPVTNDHARLVVTARGRQPYIADVPAGGSTTPVHYVDSGNGTPESPYTNWATAATVIQHAIDVASPGDMVLVTNGVYAVGSRVAGGQTTLNRIVVPADIVVKSVNGPDLTQIVGVMGTGEGFDGAVRCAYLSDGVLSGFTLTNGCAPPSPSEINESGGGVFMAGGCVSNCVLVGNRATWSGGAHDGTLYNCRIEENDARYGGGAGGAKLYNCLVSGNRATQWGGGGVSLWLYGCTVADNSAGDKGGGVYHLMGMDNSILYYNTATNAGDNYDSSSVVGLSRTRHSCLTPDGAGTVGVTTDPPQFVSHGSGNYRLSAASPCIDTGHNMLSHGDEDLDGNVRIRNGTVDMGAYESVSATVTVPSIYLQPGRVELSTPVDVVPGTETLDLRNIGEGSMIYTVATNAAWLAVSPTSGSNTGEIDELTLTIDVSALGAGVHTGIVSVSCAEADNSPQTAEVVLTVLEEGGEPGPVAPATHYVNVANVGGDVSPYTNWATAAITIQDAVDAASPSSTIWVADGVYDSGSLLTPVPDAQLQCRVVITNGVALRSLNGPDGTHIVGASAPGGGNGNGAVRCVYLATNATMSGFTIRDGYTRTYRPLSSDPDADFRGGGVVTDEYALDRVGMYATGGLISNCVFTGNSSSQEGGATWGVNCVNCLFVGNTSRSGGATAYGSAINSTIADNVATWIGGGTYGTDLRNSIIYHNTRNGTPGSNISDPIGHSRANEYNCTTIYPLYSHNVTDPPRFVDRPGGNYRLAPDSPCLGAGSNAYVDWDRDLDGAPRIYGGAVDMGAYELGYVDYWLGVSVSTLGTATSHGDSPPNQTFTVENLGADPIDYNISTDVGWMMASPGSGSSSGEADTVTVHYYSDTLPIGIYTGIVAIASSQAPNSPQSVVVTLTVNQNVFYVDVDNSTPQEPYANWGTAANTIQEAVDLAASGSTVLVADGVYGVGGKSYFNGYYYAKTTNRVVILKNITVESVNGAAHTTILGSEGIGGGCGTGAVRCVFMQTGTLRGFTLTNGHTVVSGLGTTDTHGGGVYAGPSAHPRTVIVEECTIIGNAAAESGGGAHRCTVRHCLIKDNRAGDGGGGGCSVCEVDNCLVIGNTTTGEGGGLNSATRAENCTIVDNSATNGGGGVYWGSLDNCIIYYNHAPTGPNWKSPNTFSMWNLCTTPLPAAGQSVITNAPSFVDRAGGNYRLSYLSPCRDVGNNYRVDVDVDYDGNPRIQNVTVDIGCYEFEPASAPSIPAAWWEKFGVAPSNTVMGDLDNDGWDNFSEYVLDTHPDDSSVNFPSTELRVVPEDVKSPAILEMVIDPSSTGRVYDVLWRTDLLDIGPWQFYGMSVWGNGGALHIILPENGGNCFYRVRVSVPE